MVVTNPWSTGYPDQWVGFDLVGPPSEDVSVTCDRREFLGLQGRLRTPRAVVLGESLSGRTGAGFDPCMATQRTVTVDPGETVHLTGLLAAASDRPTLLALLQRWRAVDPQAHLRDERQRWHDRLSRVTVAHRIPPSTS